MTDAELVERARQGDRTAFGDLVDRHRAAVFRQRRRITRWWRLFAQTRADRERGRVEDDYASGDRSPEETLADDRLRRDIAREIRSLSPKLRDALLLAQSGEYSYEDIGIMVNSPVGTVKWRVSEARRLVKKRLRECGYADVG